MSRRLLRRRDALRRARFACSLRRARFACSLRRARSARGDQRGNSLLLALLFVSSISFLGGVSLDYAFSTIRQAAADKDAQAARYAAGGAVDEMVAAMRADLTWGRDGSACGSVSLTMSDGRTATAACTPISGSGSLLADGTGARANRVVDVLASVQGVPYVKARITLNDAAGSIPAANVAIREWISGS
jgi:hypothetical protein